jgi:hypothetical protein
MVFEESILACYRRVKNITGGGRGRGYVFQPNIYLANNMEKFFEKLNF